MKLKFITLIVSAILCATSLDAATIVNQYGKDNKVCDPVLIYTGGLSKRLTWNKSNLRPWLTHTYSDGHTDWFYDTFIFNETIWTSRADGETRVLVNAGGGQLPATKADWIEYLDHIFSPTNDMAVLDELIDDYKTGSNGAEKLGDPRLRHKIIIGMPYPCKDGRGTPTQCEWKKFDFGEIDGVDMNFANIRHRITACKWFINEAISRFESAGYKNIDLAGFYCPDETMYSIGDIVPTVNQYIKNLGYNTYWIPYFKNNDQYALNCKDTYKFDLTWRQPNYFFNDYPPTPKSQLIDCIIQSKEYGLGLELEFEAEGTSNGLHSANPGIHQRLVDYLDAYEEYGVWAESGVAHYAGSKGFWLMETYGDEVDHATIDRLADFVVSRLRAFSAEAGINDINSDETGTFAHSGKGYIRIAGAPDAVVYSLTGAAMYYGEGTFASRPGLYIASDGHGRSCKILVH